MIGGSFAVYDAKKAGFTNAQEMIAANERGISNGKAWVEAKAADAKFTAESKSAENIKQAETATISKNSTAVVEKTVVAADNDSAQQEQPKRNPNLNPAKNMALITSYLKQTKINWHPVGADVCISDNYCSIYAANLQIQAIGGRVDIFPSASVSTSNYVMMCSVVLSGLSSLTIDQTSNYIVQAFEEGSRSGGSKYKIADVDLQIRAGGDSRLLCNYFRMTK